jgi:hypothetical protein
MTYQHVIRPSPLTLLQLTFDLNISNHTVRYEISFDISLHKGFSTYRTLAFMLHKIFDTGMTKRMAKL